MRRAWNLLGAGLGAAGTVAAVVYCAPPPSQQLPPPQLPPPQPQPPQQQPQRLPSLRSLAHEAVGTGLIVLLGCGSVASVKYLASGMTLGGVSIIWGSSVALAVYATRDASGAHLNPAITAALAVHRPEAVPLEMALGYMAAQTLGAAGAALLNYAVFSRAIAEFEAKGGLVRGAPGSAASYAGAFACLPSPGRGALAAEVLATSILSYLVFALTDARTGAPSGAQPALVGCAVTALVSVFGPVCGAGMNPARDLGPRLVTLLMGWKGEGLRGAPAYTLGPLLGAVLGAGAYDALSALPA